VTETKKCRICGEELPLEAFNRDRKERDGHSRWCRSCQKEYKVNSYAKEACTEGPFTCQNCGEEFDTKDLTSSAAYFRASTLQNTALRSATPSSGGGWP
jgi:uncharacterized CHY-type Zn-finger protein